MTSERRSKHIALGAGNYDEYFSMRTDVEAVVYLMLMNTMIHDYFPTAITIGEDVSGMPTFCRSAYFWCCQIIFGDDISCIATHVSRVTSSLPI